MLEVPVQQAADILDAIISGIGRAPQRSERIEIRGFGSFATRQRGARTGRNPRTGAPVDVPPKKIPYFKPSKDVRDLLNKSTDTQHSLAGTESYSRDIESSAQSRVKRSAHELGVGNFG